jgi:hypothetical protein
MLEEYQWNAGVRSESPVGMANAAAFSKPRWSRNVSLCHVCSRTPRAGGNPGVDQLTESGLRPRRRITAHSGMPRRADEIIRGHVVMDPGEAEAAISLGILDLLADIVERLALPRH